MILALQPKKVKTTCKGCHGGCRVIITVEKGKIVRIEGDPY